MRIAFEKRAAFAGRSLGRPWRRRRLWRAVEACGCFSSLRFGKIGASLRGQRAFPACIRFGISCEWKATDFCRCLPSLVRSSTQSLETTLHSIQIQLGTIPNTHHSFQNNAAPSPGRERGRGVRLRVPKLASNVALKFRRATFFGEREECQSFGEKRAISNKTRIRENPLRPFFRDDSPYWIPFECRKPNETRRLPSRVDTSRWCLGGPSDSLYRYSQVDRLFKKTREGLSFFLLLPSESPLDFYFVTMIRLFSDT